MRSVIRSSQMDKLIDINEEILDTLLAGENADKLKEKYRELYESISLPSSKELDVHINRNIIKKVDEKA